MIDHFERWARSARRRLSRAEWMINRLNLERYDTRGDEPGLVIIQIDGLARKQMEAAMERGRLPFLRKLLRRQHYHVKTFYSGIPSSTPAVQAELQYAVRTAVPAFSFYDSGLGRVVRMFNTDDAYEIQKRLEEQGDPLLKGGSSYSNVYCGGADEAHVCASEIGFSRLFHRGEPFSIPLFILLHARSFARTLGMVIIELILGIVDCVRGLIKGENLMKELKFIPTRVAVTIGTRELIVAGVTMDVARGVPIIHCNFLGYDEQSHRRGPTSEFAHWGLKGIDDAVRRVWHSAHRSHKRHYDVWIFSDHGQEEVESYAAKHGRSVADAVCEVFDQSKGPAQYVKQEQGGVQGLRAILFGSKTIQRFVENNLMGEGEAVEDLPIVAAMGPVGHVYPRHEMTQQERETMARRLALEAEIPMVFIGDGPGRAKGWDMHGNDYVLPEDIRKVVGREMVFESELAEDMLAMIQHPDAGVFVLLGWQPESCGLPMSFPHENGSHAGPGTTETEGFALLPRDVSLADTRREYVRAEDLHFAAQRLLGRREGGSRASVERERRHETLRVMTYNVHSCIGMDGRHSPERIARLIALYDPDVVCLQELDLGRERSDQVDQAHRIAQVLEMMHHFHPTLQVEEEKYGDAILSRFPMKLVKAEALPGLPSRPGLEPRGALWVEIDTGGDMPIQVINTHLGLLPAEQRAQVEALRSSEWLGHEACRGPVVLCGDFNALPRSSTCRMLTSSLLDVQLNLEGHRPRNTFFGRAPLGRIDHVFINDGWQVRSVDVPKSALAQVASDHLPLVVDLVRQEVPAKNRA